MNTPSAQPIAPLAPEPSDWAERYHAATTEAPWPADVSAWAGDRPSRVHLLAKAKEHGKIHGQRDVLFKLLDEIRDSLTLGR
jgi:hypothetical protein